MLKLTSLILARLHGTRGRHQTRRRDDDQERLAAVIRCPACDCVLMGGLEMACPMRWQKRWLEMKRISKVYASIKEGVERGRTLLSRIGRSPREGRNQRVYVQKCPRYIVDGRPQMQKKGVAEMKMRRIRVSADQMPQPRWRGWCRCRPTVPLTGKLLMAMDVAVLGCSSRSNAAEDSLMERVFGCVTDGLAVPDGVRGWVVWVQLEQASCWFFAVLGPGECPEHYRLAQPVLVARWMPKANTTRACGPKFVPISKSRHHIRPTSRLHIHIHHRVKLYVLQEICSFIPSILLSSPHHLRWETRRLEEKASMSAD